MISGKALAQQIGVALPTLSQAAAKGHLCRGHDVSAWAVRGPSGRVIGYELPVSVTATLTPPAPRAQSGDGRPGGTPSVVTPTLTPVRNPSPGGDGSADGTALWLPPLTTAPARKNPSSDGGSSPDASMPPRSVRSVLPPRVDYFRPVAAASTAHVVTEAIRHDNPSARHVISAVSVAGCALTGYHIGGKVGALVGASIGLVLAYQQQRDVSPSLAAQPVMQRRMHVQLEADVRDPRPVETLSAFLEGDVGVVPVPSAHVAPAPIWIEGERHARPNGQARGPLQTLRAR